MVYLSDDERPDADAFDIAAFKQEAEILHLILYRNRNQHHVSHWWKYLEMLHQRCFQVVDDYEKRTKRRDRELQRRLARTGKGMTKAKNNSSKSKRDDRIPVWAESKRIGQIALFLYKSLIPSAYRNFHGMLAQGAFITLGMALLGATARIYRLIGPIVMASKRGAEVARRRKSKVLQNEKEVEVEISTERSASATTVVEMRKHGEALENDIGEVVSLEELEAMRKETVSLQNWTDLTEDAPIVNASSGLSSVKRGPSPVVELDDLPVPKKSKTRKTNAAEKSGDMETAAAGSGDGREEKKTKKLKKTKKSKKKNAIDSIFGGF